MRRARSSPAQLPLWELPPDARVNALPDDAEPREIRRAAYLDGQTAGAGRVPRMNPWDGLAPTWLECALSRSWARGFSRGNPVTRLIGELYP